MIGIVIVTHGRIGEEMLTALNTIVGPQEQASAISIGNNDDMEKSRDDIMRAITEVNTGAGVILLTDMFGGTPNNLAIAAMPRSHAVVMAGVNMPMLVKLASIRETTPLMDAVREAEMAGRKYIQSVSDNIVSATGT
ncbi:MAG: PTS fructose transporter subunit IIA [Alphaproteobacteria bacterium]|nr:PTS fructose transporter subunit IIA [Alphaproteobacteria bacterium]